MGEGCSRLPLPIPPVPPLDPVILNKIQETVGKLIVSLPVAYMTERERIIEEMRQAAPKPYKNLLYADYPNNNGAKVNALACQTVTSDAAKKELANQVNKEIQPQVEAIITDINPIARAAFLQAIQIAIEKSINEAVDTVIKNIKKTDTQPRSKA